MEDAKSTIESQQELFNAIADKEFTIGNGYYMKIVKPGESLPYELGIVSGKYQKKWTATLSAPLAVKGNSGDTAFVVTSVLEAFGIPKECWHWDDKNQVLTMGRRTTRPGTTDPRILPTACGTSRSRPGRPTSSGCLKEDQIPGKYKTKQGGGHIKRGNKHVRINHDWNGDFF